MRDPSVIRIAAMVNGGTLRRATLPVGISPAHTNVTSVNNTRARVSRGERMKGDTVAERRRAGSGGSVTSPSLSHSLSPAIGGQRVYLEVLLARIIGNGFNSRFKGSSINPRASRVNAPSRVLSSASP